uniref:C-type lectin domain-containing protein n=1 Tax=Sparus aurata TaxID=8175 RepID=A0A671UAJ6_SPAAU
MPAVETIVAISSHARLTKTNLNGFLPSPYKATSRSFTALTRTSVSSAVNRSWRALCHNLFKVDTCHKCQEGWEQNGPQCYYFSTDKLTWEQAREKCRRDGADLVKIESEDEQVEHTAMVEKEDKFWIGLTDSVTEGTWLWPDGTPLNKSLTFWSSQGEPDDWKGVNNENVDGEDCVRMGEKSGSGLKWWFDKSCMAPQKRICEKSAETGRPTCI